MRPRLTREAWQCAVVLHVLVKAGLPIGLPQLGRLLETDQTTLYAIIARLRRNGLVDAELLEDRGTGRRQSAYSASLATRMATNTLGS